MSDKGWLLVGGIVAYLLWRGQAMSAATSISGAGNGTPPTPGITVGAGSAPLTFDHIVNHSLAN